ncbi:carboxypeptidase regulatory-like domain-containing protein [Candidatus Dependentiae bacterium]|nr:carboxypeptidase regulatory-like domain-containing protein [Candidatus Dependentiae bacterium]
MSSQKSLGALLILISILLLSMSFGHEYIEELTPAELTIRDSSYKVTPGSEIVVSFDFFETFGTRPYSIQIEGNGVDVSTPQITLDYREVYSGSLSFTAPTTPGSYTYYTHTYMYASHPTTGALTEVEFAYDKLPITVITAEAEVPTCDLTVKVIDENSNALAGAEVSINTGVIGTTDSSGTVMKSNLTAGPWTVTATKEDFSSDSVSVTMTADKVVTLQLTLIEEPDPTPEPTEDFADHIEDIPSDSTLSVTYKFTIEMFDSNNPPNPIENAKIMIDGKAYYTDSSGKVLHITKPGETITVVVTKEGYNNFQKAYTVTSNTVVKVTLIPSGGDFFFNLDVREDNPFYDPHGVLSVVPIWIVISSLLFFFAGVYLAKKQ